MEPSARPVRGRTRVTRVPRRNASLDTPRRRGPFGGPVRCVPFVRCFRHEPATGAARCNLSALRGDVRPAGRRRRPAYPGGSRRPRRSLQPGLHLPEGGGARRSAPRSRTDSDAPDTSGLGLARGLLGGGSRSRRRRAGQRPPPARTRCGRALLRQSRCPQPRAADPRARLQAGVRDAKRLLGELRRSASADAGRAAHVRTLRADPGAGRRPDRLLPHHRRESPRFQREPDERSRHAPPPRRHSGARRTRGSSSTRAVPTPPRPPTSISPSGRAPMPCCWPPCSR